jgi:hypothetical protein
MGIFMKMRTKHMLNAVVVLLLMGGVVAHAQVKSKAAKAAERKLNDSAYVARQAAIEGGFEKFKAKTFKEPFKDGVYIVDGDVPIVSEDDLRAFYDNEIVLGWKQPKFGYILNARTGRLITNNPGPGQLRIWNNVQKKNISYCVTTAFQGRYNQVVQAMQAAAQAWEEVSDVRFVHVNSLDNQCSNATQGVVFNVGPIPSNDSGGYLARAFFPNTPRQYRSLIINDTAFRPSSNINLTLVGILRHELGHVLSFRHEHTRPEAGPGCFENNEWTPITPYDAFSVMHYPQCNGQGDWSLSLTDDDKLGAACVYGPAPGVAFNPANCLSN